MGLYLELGFFVFLSTPFLGLALAPKIKLVTSILLASVLKFFKEFKNLLDPFTMLRWEAFELSELPELSEQTRQSKARRGKARQGEARSMSHQGSNMRHQGCNMSHKRSNITHQGSNMRHQSSNQEVLKAISVFVGRFWTEI